MTMFEFITLHAGAILIPGDEVKLPDHDEWVAATALMVENKALSLGYQYRRKINSHAVNNLRKSGTTCPVCGVEMIDVVGVGPVCNNTECKQTLPDSDTMVCPWCGESAITGFLGFKIRLLCINPDCPVQPTAQVTYDSVREASKAWAARRLA